MECDFWTGPRYNRPVLLVWEVARAGRHWSLTECLCQSWVPPTHLPLFLHESSPFLDLALCSLMGAVWRGCFVELFWLLQVTACFALCHCPCRSCSTLPPHCSLEMLKGLFFTKLGEQHLHISWTGHKKYAQNGWSGLTRCLKGMLLCNINYELCLLSHSFI